MAIFDRSVEGIFCGEAPEAISRRIGEYVTSSFGLKLDDLDLAMIVGGYALYFNKKGLA